MIFEGPPNNAARRATRTAKKDEKKEDEKKVRIEISLLKTDLWSFEAAPTTVRLGPIKAYPDEPKMAAAAAAATAAGDNGEPEGYKVHIRSTPSDLKIIIKGLRIDGLGLKNRRLLDFASQ